MILVADNDWPKVIRNLVKARTVWWRMSKILSREGARLQVPGFFFKSIIQLVLLSDAESWVVTTHMGRYLRGFQDQVVKQLTGRLSWQSLNGRWDKNLAEAERAEARFEIMEIFRIQLPIILQLD